MEEQGTEFESLPVEVTQKILEKLPFTSLIHCKLLSKSLPEIMNDQHFALNHISNAAKSNPFLFISCKNSLYFLDMASTEISGSAYLKEFKKINIPFQLPDFYIGGSCSGYLCLSTSSTPGNSPYERSYPFGSIYDDVTFVWNPFTTNFVELPSSAKQLSWAFGFGFHPLTREHKVVKMYNDEHAQYMQILTLGTNHWRSLRAPSNVKTRALVRTKNRGICVNGSLHWLGKKYEEQDMSTFVILALDLATEELKEIPLPDNVESAQCENLMEISGCPTLVVLNEERLEIWVMKNYGVKDSWKLQFVIGDYAKRVAEQFLMKKNRGEINVTGGFPLKPDNVICLLKDDKLLIQFTVGGVLCYDFINERFMDFSARGLPNLRGCPYEYEAIALTGSLIHIN